MGIRAQMQAKPIIGVIAGIALIAIAGGAIGVSLWKPKAPDLSKAFYTVDDGATWFVDSSFRIPPFDHDGKPAVAAHVFSCDDGKKQFCAYETRYTAAGKTTIEKAIADAQSAGRKPGSVALFQDRWFNNTAQEAKKPGSGTWVALGSPKVNEIFTVTAPDGSTVDEVLAR